MTPRIITFEVSVRRELRREERCLGLLSPDGERAVVICRRQVEVVEVVAVIDEVDVQTGSAAPPSAALICARDETT